MNQTSNQREPLHLSPDELEELTGYRRRKEQIRYLTRQGFRFAVNGLGEPVVAREEYRRKMVGGSRRGA